MKAVFAILLAWEFSAHGLTAECTLENKKVVLNVSVERPDAYSSKDWKFTINGKGSRKASIRVVDGPRHRRGIDGYEVEIREGAGPLSPRTVYSFWTRECVSDGGELQVYTGAGAHRNSAKGEPVQCECRD